MKLTDIERERYIVLLLHAIFIEEIKGWRFVDDKDVDLMLFGGLDNGLVTFKKHKVVYPVAMQEINGRVAFLDGYDKTLQGINISYAAEFIVEKCRDFDAGIGFAKIKPVQTFPGYEGRIYDIIVSGLHALQGIFPVHGQQFNPNTGFFLPESPLIDQDSLDDTVAVQKGVRRIIVIHNHPDGDASRRLRGSRSGLGMAKSN